ncbi:MAG: hypothetical protein AAF798_12920 [Bacteroidota bacterium]
MKKLYYLLLFCPLSLFAQDVDMDRKIRFGLLLFPEMTSVQFNGPANIQQRANTRVGLSLGGQVQVLLGKGVSARMTLLKGERQYEVIESGTNLSPNDVPITRFQTTRDISIESFDFQLALGYEFGNKKSLWSVHAGIAYHIYENAQVSHHSVATGPMIYVEEMDSQSIALQDNGNLSGVFSLSYARFLGAHFAAFVEPSIYVNLQEVQIDTMQGYRFMGGGLAFGIRYFVGATAQRSRN